MKLHPHNIRRRAHQAAMTLIELLVVLVILTGLGSLILPTINDALTRTHLATCSGNFPAVHAMIQRALFDGGNVGSGFDSGVAQTPSGTTSVNGYTIGTLDANEVTALNNIGITTVVDHGAAAGDPTFDIDPQSETITTGTQLIVFDGDTARNTYGLYMPNATADDNFVFLSIGRDWTRLGEFAPEPPVHFGDTPGNLPNEVHSRFGIVLQVSDVDGAFTNAQFMTVGIALDGSGIETRDAHTEVYWTEVVSN